VGGEDAHDNETMNITADDRSSNPTAIPTIVKISVISDLDAILPIIGFSIRKWFG
jgi:hypothetical protein